MPRKIDKLLEKARQTKAGWMPHELLSLYEGFGFIIREGSGSHKIISHPKHSHLRATLPNHPRELPKKYVADAVKNIDALMKLEEGSEENG